MYKEMFDKSYGIVYCIDNTNLTKSIMVKITTVGQLQKALSHFKPEDKLDLIVDDDFQTYDIGLDLYSLEAPGLDDDDIRFFNNGHCRMDFHLTAKSSDYVSVPKLAKVIKR